MKRKELLHSFPENHNPREKLIQVLTWLANREEQVSFNSLLKLYFDNKKANCVLCTSLSAISVCPGEI